MTTPAHVPPRRREAGMSLEVSERAFEETIEAALLRHGPDAPRGAGTTVRESPPPYGDDPLPAATASADQRTTTVHSACSRPTSSTSSWSPSRKSGRSSSSTTGPTSSRASSGVSRARSPGGSARRAAQRRQGLGLQVPAGLLPARERAERGAAAPARGQPLRGGAPAPLQREGRAEPRPRALPQRHPHLHGRAQEPAQRPGRPGRESGNIATTGIRASRSSATRAASPTSPWTRSRCS